MDRHDHSSGGRTRQDLPAMLRQLERRAENRLRRGASKTDDDRRLDGAQLDIEPRTARLDLRPARLLVDTALSTWFPLEVFHRIGDIHVGAWDACFRERLVEERTSRPDERQSLSIFLIARLLTDEHHASATRPGTEDGLCRVFVEITAPTLFRGGLQCRQAGGVGDERRG